MPSSRPPAPRRNAAAAGIAAALALTVAAGAARAQTAAEAELAGRLDRLAAELASVRSQLDELRRQRGGTGAPAAAAAPSAAGPATAAAGSSAATATAPAPAPTAAAPASTATASAPPPASAMASAAPASAYALAPSPYRAEAPATVLSSYGEINYNRPRRASENTVADLRRLVFGFQHRFDPKTKVVTEIEVEHAVSSAGDPGEVAVEQAYVEHELHPRWAVRGGLFLMPAGLINENHEPTAYYGVERNFVETAIIPTTWREGGVQLIHARDDGLTLQGGVSTGFDLTKWDAASAEGAESPLGAVHQELALAKARSLALFGAANWRGVPGLLLGGSLFSGGATHRQTPTGARVTLWDLHARWTPGRWDLAALYSRGSISGTADLNTPLVGQPTLIPRVFDGGYVQAAYRLWARNGYALVPFARVERYNTGRSYADLGPGLTPAAMPTEQVATLGASFYVGSGVVLKADVQRFRVRSDADRLNLGLGWAF